MRLLQAGVRANSSFAQRCVPCRCKQVNNGRLRTCAARTACPGVGVCAHALRRQDVFCCHFPFKLLPDSPVCWSRRALRPAVPGVRVLWCCQRRDVRPQLQPGADMDHDQVPRGALTRAAAAVRPRRGSMSCAAQPWQRRRRRRLRARTQTSRRARKRAAAGTTGRTSGTRCVCPGPVC